MSGHYYDRLPAATALAITAGPMAATRFARLSAATRFARLSAALAITARLA